MTQQEDDKLPPGKTCGDCEHFKPVCEWFVSAEKTDMRCDWSPSRFVEITPVGHGGQAK